VENIDLVKHFLSMGVGGALAFGMFLVYRKDALQQADQWKGQTEILLQVIRENTTATTALTRLIEREISV